MSRKLVSLKTVSKIVPIDGADFVELAVVDGWKCVVKKGEFQVGDRGVYFEIDSFLPIENRYEFLRSSGYKKMLSARTGEMIEGFRLKTRKFRGQISQGLLMPLTEFPNIDMIKAEDLAEFLNVEKYEPPVSASLAGEVKGCFPSFLRKTDEERIQNLPEYFEYCKEVPYEVTEKLDGSSMTVYLNNGDFGVCSRNIDLKETDGNTYWQVVREINLEKAMRNFGQNVAIQGELVGEGIQKNPLCIKGHKFFVFHVWDIDNACYFDPRERMDFLFMLRMGTINFFIKHVPVLYHDVKVFKKITDMDSLLSFADGKSALNEKVKREGLVFKPMYHAGLEGTSFKVISNQYLLKH